MHDSTALLTLLLLEITYFDLRVEAKPPASANACFLVPRKMHTFGSLDWARYVSNLSFSGATIQISGCASPI